jgi:hypothetical protein
VVLHPPPRAPPTCVRLPPPLRQCQWLHISVGGSNGQGVTGPQVPETHSSRHSSRHTVKQTGRHFSCSAEGYHMPDPITYKACADRRGSPVQAVSADAVQCCLQSQAPASPALVSTKVAVGECCS